MNKKFKKFLSYYRPYLGMFVFTMSCAFIVSAILLIYPLLIRYVTKKVLEGNMPHALHHIYAIGAVMIGLIVIQTVCYFIFDYQGHKMGAFMERDMRRELFTHYQKLSFKFYDNQKTGQLMSRLTNDLLLLSELYHHGPEDYLRYIVQFAGAFFILFSINQPLTLAVFCFMPVICVFAFYFNKKLNRALKRNKERIADIHAQVEDSLSGIKVVKSFTNEEFEIQKFSYENDRFLESRKNTYKNEAYYYNGMEILIQFITVTVVLYGGVNIVHASLDLADLITFIFYITYLIEPIQKLTHLTMQYQEGITGFQRFMEIIEIEPDLQDSPDAVDLKHAQGQVEFRNVSFKYHENQDHVFKNISLVIDEGEYVALVGPSGVGKTTLCSLIPRFYEVMEGEVLIDGINIKEISLNSLRRNIGVVQQDVYLFSGSVRDNIRYGKLDASEDEIIEAAQNANAHSFIMKLPDGYDTDIGQRGVRLSGGQKQRLSIARVFLKNPPILIFDEATSALDNESERVVKEALEALSKNRTTLVIAHRLSTIRKAERIVVLNDNGISEQGTHEQLLALEGNYSNLYNMQFEV